CAKIDKSSIKVLPIFKLLQQKGNIPERDMYNTYNMGVGMALIVSKETADKAIATLKDNGIDAYVIGEMVANNDTKIILEQSL
ncbi:MAG: phosphoribosylformylglycinamidine cyclo-ligase, partial [Clostridia bacterium]|nr:phosphoribosylformylglycinamidine cyclo-ligase [Clostridia bacterium]